MKRLTKYLNFLLTGGCMLFFLSFCSPCSATGYYVTETELTQLESNLEKLSQLNTESQKRLMTLQSELTASERELAETSDRLKLLAETSQTQENLLRTAKESSEKYAREQKRKLRQGKWQRSILCLLIAGLIVAG